MRRMTRKRPAEMATEDSYGVDNDTTESTSKTNVTGPAGGRKRARRGMMRMMPASSIENGQQQQPQDYDYDMPARFFRVKTEDLFGKPNGPKLGDLCLVYSGEQPESKKDVEEFIQKYKLHHGDVVCFGDYRDTGSFIVLRNPSGQMSWLENPDDSNSGYLTIPAQVLHNVKDTITKYNTFLKANHPLINFHISREDRFLTERLGSLPDTCEFILNASYGDVETLSVKIPKKDWHEFNLIGEGSRGVWDRIRNLVGVKPVIPKAEFSVHVNLQGEKLRRYKEKYSGFAERNGYILAVPDLPSSWVVYRGPGGQKPDRLFWVWHFKGDGKQKQEAIESTKAFLKGFDAKFNIK